MQYLQREAEQEINIPNSTWDHKEFDAKQSPRASVNTYVKMELTTDWLQSV
jgi:hypothetical protein